MRRTLWAIGITWVAGCPVSVPTEAAPTSSTTASSPATPLAPHAAPDAERTHATEARDPGPALHETSAARPIVTSFRRAIASLHEGDADPIHTLLDEQAAWTVPVAHTQARDRDALVTALRDRIAGPTRILDLGARAFATQLRTTDGRDVLAILDVADARITAVRTYGSDPGAPPSAPPSRMANDASVTAIATGRPQLEHVAVTKRIYEAASSHAWSKIEASVARGATHETHSDIAGGPGDEATFIASLTELLADPTARLTIRKQHAVGPWVLVEAVVGQGEGVTLRPTVGFVDVLRLEDGRIAASVRYLNHRPSGGVSR